MSRKLFGTDGIRGKAGDPPLDRPHAFALGVALAEWIHAKHLHPGVVIGMDTRESGPWLAGSVAAGLQSLDVHADFAGVVTTPGVAFLARTDHYAAGIMISASHNPFEDNGIKVFDHSGYKMPDDEELKLEAGMFAWLAKNEAPTEQSLVADETLDRKYITFLESTIQQRLDGMHLVIDCANGAASKLAPTLFRELGAQVTAIGDAPDGRNINLNCGSLHLEGLRERVLAAKADLGIAFDGDADRALFVTGAGKLVDGDAVMLVTAIHMKVKGVVATVMSNLGLEKAFTAHGIEMVRANVGDKYVLDEMIKRNLTLGGEQSGHIIFRELATTGDGMLTALQVLSVIRQTGRTLDELTAALTVYPQILVNVRVKERKPLADLPAVRDEISAAEAAFAGSGRVLVRFSGTEPLARVMIEGADKTMVDDWAHRIAATIRQELGG
ncbi:MAG TPA: phosphoglucosamine mutase [Bryobacteraceae bacterium]|jgi:phosphoglucosamine mutase